MHGLDARRFAWGNHLSLTTMVALIAIVIAAFIYLAIRRLRRMDIP